MFGKTKLPLVDSICTTHEVRDITHTHVLAEDIMWQMT